MSVIEDIEAEIALQRLEERSRQQMSPQRGTCGLVRESWSTGSRCSNTTNRRNRRPNLCHAELDANERQGPITEFTTKPVSTRIYRANPCLEARGGVVYMSNPI